MLEIPPIPDKEFFSIGDVSQITQLPAYVLRYWESEFNLLRPARRSSGQRKYIKKDIETVFVVKDLLYTKKYTIAGAKKYLLGDKRRKDNTHRLNFDMKPAIAPAIVSELRAELEEIVKLLK